MRIGKRRKDRDRFLRRKFIQILDDLGRHTNDHVSPPITHYDSPNRIGLLPRWEYLPYTVIELSLKDYFPTQTRGREKESGHTTEGGTILHRTSESRPYRGARI